ncbi:MAG TPA: hypothetical protein ENK49_01320 [Gammaproteobacteria bacterium]|nr:hypothetical protein [Gammaproteobacteria bacterium]
MSVEYRKMAAGLCLCVWLAGCQQAGSRNAFYDNPLLAGDEVEVLQTITIPAGLARIYLQHGKTMGYGSTDQYAPFCYFLMRDPLPVEQQIQPGVLVVESVWLDETSVRLERPLRVAGMGLAFGGDRTPIAYQSYMTLRSEQQGTLTLVCSGAFDMALTAQPIRLPEMREALGDFARVRVKETAAQ